jgi:hypothetical protein
MNNIYSRLQGLSIQQKTDLACLILCEINLRLATNNYNDLQSPERKALRAHCKEFLNLTKQKRLKQCKNYL